MARMKFLCDTKRCIECNGCVTACKNENDDAESERPKLVFKVIAAPVIRCGGLGWLLELLFLVACAAINIALFSAAHV